MNPTTRPFSPKVSTFSIDGLTVVVRFLLVQYRFGFDAVRNSAAKPSIVKYNILPTLFSPLPPIGSAYCTEGAIELEFNKPFRQILLDRGFQVEHPESPAYEDGFDDLVQFGMKLSCLLGDVSFESTSSSLSILMDSRL